MEVVIIGTGKVGSFFAKEFFRNGVKISGLYNRSLSKAEELAQQVDSQVFRRIEDLPANADFYIISVNDSNIEQVAGHNFFRDKFVLHTAGAVSVDILGRSVAYGVLYPLQTFAKPVLSPENTPLLIEANTEANLAKPEKLARKISRNVYKLSSQQRLFAHLAAVFGNNFVNHLLFIAKEILLKRSLPPEILNPILEQTVYNALKFNAFEIQTGPARRNDKISIKNHKEILKTFPENFGEIYDVLTKSIVRTYNG